MSVLGVPDSVAAHFSRVVNDFASGLRRILTAEHEPVLAGIEHRLTDAARRGDLATTLAEVLPGPSYFGEPLLAGHSVPQGDAEVAAGYWFLKELADGRCHQIAWASRTLPMYREGGPLAGSNLPPCDTWAVPLWVTSAVESHFAWIGEFEGTVAALRFLKDSDFVGGDRVDELIAHAALLDRRWDTAWEYRHVGLLWGGERLTVDDILLIRAMCSTTSLEPRDVHQLTLTESGLTEFGKAHLREIDESLAAQLQHRHTEEGANFVASAAARYLGRPLAERDFEEMADEIDYAVTPEKLKMSWTYGNTRASQRRFWSKPQIPSATRYAARHLATIDELGYMDPDLARLSQPNADVNAVFAERDRKRHETHPQPSPPIEVVTIGVSGELHYNFVSSPGWFETYAQLLGATVLRRAENEVREAHGIPVVGAGWVGESVLFDLVRSAFPDQTVVRHARPDWLAPQHLDVYLPGFQLALEYQGLQHHEPVEYFGGEAAFRRQLKRDRKKRLTCGEAGCTLIEVLPGYDPGALLSEVRIHAARIGIELPGEPGAL